MAKQSAGILLFRSHNDILEVLLVHPGGPYWAYKESGAWSIPKGEFDAEENALDAAILETKEELGLSVSGHFIPLNPVKIKSGKIIHAWALEGNFNEADLVSNEFEMEWPSKSGMIKSFPEVDKAKWMNMNVALEKINTGQIEFLIQLESILTDRTKTN